MPVNPAILADPVVTLHTLWGAIDAAMRATFGDGSYSIPSSSAAYFLLASPNGLGIILGALVDCSAQDIVTRATPPAATVTSHGRHRSLPR
jgi:hypothetical protein